MKKQKHVKYQRVYHATRRQVPEDSRPILCLRGRGYLKCNMPSYSRCGNSVSSELLQVLLQKSNHKLSFICGRISSCTQQQQKEINVITKLGNITIE